jgi:predicted amidohydrolase
MKTPIKIAACQVPEVREDVRAALSWIEKYAQRAWTAGAHLVCFPECFLQGYLVEEEPARRHAIELRSPAFDSVLNRLSRAKPVLVFGMIEADAGLLFNTAVVIRGGRLVGKYRKMHLLPGENIFSPGASCPVFKTDGLTFGINVCFDTQFPATAARVLTQGGRLIVCPANNMMKRDKAEKWKDRHNQIRACRAKETGLWLISSDVTGTRGNSVGLGPTCVIDPRGSVVRQVPLMQEGMVVATIV